MKQTRKQLNAQEKRDRRRAKKTTVLEDAGQKTVEVSEDAQLVVEPDCIEPDDIAYIKELLDSDGSNEEKFALATVALRRLFPF